MDFRLLIDRRFDGVESPVWDDRRECLFFVEMAAKQVHRVDLSGDGHMAWQMPEMPTALGLTQAGQLLVTQPRRLLLLHPDSNIVRHFVDIPGEPEGNRLNDGKVGPDGAFWVGSMRIDRDDHYSGSLYRVTGKGVVKCVRSSFCQVFNGLAWSIDGRIMVHSDSRDPSIIRYDFDPQGGALGDPSTICKPNVEMGWPDGAAFDSGGRYWSAGVSAGKLNAFRMDGSLERAFDVPGVRPSMVGFCGLHLDYMVVTTLGAASGTLPAPSGAVFIASTRYRGVPIGRVADL